MILQEYYKAIKDKYEGNYALISIADDYEYKKVYVNKITRNAIHIYHNYYPVYYDITKISFIELVEDNDRN